MTSSLSPYHYPTNNADEQLATYLTLLIECKLNLGTAHQPNSLHATAQLLARHRGEKAVLRPKDVSRDTFYKWRRCE